MYAIVANEFDISQKARLAMILLKQYCDKKEIETDKLDLLLKMSYIDDLNKGGTLRAALLDHQITKILGQEYGKRYAPQKSIIALHADRKVIDKNMRDFIEDGMELKIKEMDDYKVLGTKMNASSFNDHLLKKINDSRRRLDTVKSMDNNLQKYRLLAQCLSIDGYWHFITTTPLMPSWDVTSGRFVCGKETQWIGELGKLCDEVLLHSTNICWSDEEKLLLGLSKKSGGIALRNFNTLAAPAIIASIHRTIKPILAFLKCEIIMGGKEVIIDRLKAVIGAFNGKTQKRDNVKIDSVLHSLSSVLCKEEESGEVKKMEQIRYCEKELVNMGIRPKKVYENECEKETDLVQIKKNIKSSDKMFGVKYLRNKMDKCTYYKIYNAASVSEKVRMHANRSNKALSYLNPPIGITSEEECGMENEDYEASLRIHFGKKMMKGKDGEAGECHACGEYTSAMSEHMFLCSNGLSQIATHDKANEFLVKKCNDVITGVEWEPRVTNADGSRKKPDIIFNHAIPWKKSMHKLVIDTIVPNIYSNANKKQIEDGNNAIFCAGMLGKERKERLYASTRCDELIALGYEFNSMSVELFGGVDKVLVALVAAIFGLKLATSNQKKKIDIGLQKHNFWINWSIHWTKNLVKRALAHIPPNRRLH